MPRLCEPCRLQTADDAATSCAGCGGPVKFTLLPPPGEDAPPMAGLPSTLEEVRPKPFDLRELLRGRARVVTFAVGAAFAVAMLGLWLVRGDSFEARVAKVKPGMAVAEAMRVMGDPNRPKAKRWRIDFGGGRDERFQDFDRPVDTAGDGSLVYERGLNGVCIRYERGVVTDVEPRAAEGGRGRAA